MTIATFVSAQDVPSDHRHLTAINTTLASINTTDNGLYVTNDSAVMYMQMYFYMGTKVIFLFESY